jgi:hypothetical protein
MFLKFIFREYHYKITSLLNINKAFYAATNSKMSFLFKRKRKNGTNDNKGTVKCKKCTMTFQDKERLDIHQKKAHSGRGERKKNKNIMH